MYCLYYDPSLIYVQEIYPQPDMAQSSLRTIIAPCPLKSKLLTMGNLFFPLGKLPFVYL